MSFFRRRTSAASSHRDAKPGGGATAGDGDKGLGRKLWRKRYFKTDKGRLYYYKPNERY